MYVLVFHRCWPCWQVFFWLYYNICKYLYNCYIYQIHQSFSVVVVVVVWCLYIFTVRPHQKISCFRSAAHKYLGKTFSHKIFFLHKSMLKWLIATSKTCHSKTTASSKTERLWCRNNRVRLEFTSGADAQQLACRCSWHTPEGQLCTSSAVPG